MIIGICGEMGAGKSSLADMLCRYDHCVCLSFAGRFKRAMCELFGWEIDRMGEYEYKDSMDAVTGKKRRALMQEFATGYIRKMVDPMLHTKLVAIDTLGTIQNKLRCVVYDDVRHHDEVDFIHSVNGVLIRVVRPDNPYAQSTHESEGNILDVDFDVYNTGTIRDMRTTLLRNNLIPQCNNDSLWMCTTLLKEYINGWKHEIS